MTTLARLISTFFGVGFIPVWAATWASALAAGIAWFIPSPALAPTTAVLSLLAFWACKPAVAIFGRKDPQTFVMDEVCGMMLAVIAVPQTLPVYLAGFLLFRFFDAVKPWPIALIQKNDHPLAIVWDDLAAGLAANLCIQGYFWLRP